MLHLIEDGVDEDLLAWTVDGTVGIDTSLLDQFLTVIVTVMVVLTQHWAGLVRVCISKDIPATTDVLRLEKVFALNVCHHVELIKSGISGVFLDVQMSTCDGLARPGTDHHITHALWTWLVFGNGIDIRHEIEATDDLCFGIRLELQHIHTHGQALHRDSVLKELIGGFACIFTRRFIDHLTQQRLDLMIAIGVIGRNIDIALCIHLIDGQRDRTEVADVCQRHLLRLFWQYHPLVERQTELRIGQFAAVVLKCVPHARPAAPPLAYGFIDIGQFLGLLVVGDVTIALHGQFATLRQIFVFLDDCVKFILRGIVIRLGCDDTGSTAVAHLFIIVIHRLIVLVVVHLEADDVQEVVVEDAGINALDDKRTVGSVLHPCELFTEFWCQHRFFDGHAQTAVTGVDTMECCLIDRLEHHVGSSFISLLEPIHGRSQRVWGDVRHHLGTLQLCRQQLTVVLAFLGLRHDLLQQFILGLWKVLFIGRFHLLPQGRIGLSKQRNGYHHHKQ